VDGEADGGDKEEVEEGKVEDAKDDEVRCCLSKD